MGCGARSIQNQQKLGERGRKMTPVSSHACFEVKRRYQDLGHLSLCVELAAHMVHAPPQLDELVTGGLAIVDEVEVVRYVANPVGRSKKEG